MKPLVYSIVLNWNRASDTIACLDTLQRQDYPRHNIVVVDNASSDDSVQEIRLAYPQVNLIVNPENWGFARGFNQGIAWALQANADHIFILNNDTLVSPNTISLLVESIRDNSGILAPIIYYANRPEIIWSIGGRVNTLTLEVRDETRGKPDLGRWPSIIEQDFVTGCAMFLPRTTLERVGLFDEKFTLYYEDSDFCRRVRLAGLRIYVIPAAKLWHKVSLSSGGSDSPNERYWMARSSIRFFNKHAQGWQKPIIWTYRSGSAIKTILRLLSKKRYQSLKAYLRGLQDGVSEAKNKLETVNC